MTYNTYIYIYILDILILCNIFGTWIHPNLRDLIFLGRKGFIQKKTIILILGQK